jgi:hypothetical protein
MDRNFQVGDLIELIRWDPTERRAAGKEGSIERAEVQITHIDHAAGPLVLCGMELPTEGPARLPTYHPLACLSFVFHRADLFVPLGESERCRTGDTTADLLPYVDRP